MLLLVNSNYGVIKLFPRLLHDERRGRVVDISDLYPGGDEFKSRFFSVPAYHDCVPSHSFEFTVH
jgi:hypothetical protein